MSMSLEILTNSPGSSEIHCEASNLADEFRCVLEVKSTRQGKGKGDVSTQESRVLTKIRAMKSSHCNKSVVEGEEKREEEMDEDAVKWTKSETGIAAEAQWQ